MSPLDKADAQCSQDVVAEAINLPSNPTTADLLRFGHDVWHRARRYGMHEGKEITLEVARSYPKVPA